MNGQLAVVPISKALALVSPRPTKKVRLEASAELEFKMCLRGYSMLPEVLVG